MPLHAARSAAPHYGPLSSALARLDEPLLPRSGDSADAAALLGPLLDLRGSVTLAALLDRGSSEEEGVLPADPPTAALARIRREIVDELAEVRGQLAYAFSRWCAPSSKLFGPEALTEALATRALLGPRERRTTTLAQAVWGPAVLEARKEVDHARASVRRLRQTVAPELAQTGPRAARLCALDRALSDAIETAVSLQLEKLLSATEAKLVRELAAEIAVLPAGDSRAVVDAWLSAGGRIKSGIALLSSVVHAAVESEERRLLALVDGAA